MIDYLFIISIPFPFFKSFKPFSFIAMEISPPDCENSVTMPVYGDNGHCVKAARGTLTATGYFLLTVTPPVKPCFADTGIFRRTGGCAPAPE